MNAYDTNTEKLQGRDCITGGIFSALCIVALLFAAIMNISGYTAVFYPIAAAFFIGILFVIVVNKVCKRGIVLIFSIVPCIYFFTSGILEGLIGAAGILVFAAAAEAILWKERGSTRITIACIVYTLYLSTIGCAENFLATDTYCDNALAHGINAALVEQMRVLYHIKPLWLAVIAGTALFSLAGAGVGRKIMKKHLKKAGMI